MNEADFDRRLDAALRQAFAPPSDAALAELAAQATAVRRPPRWPWLVAAAALLVVAITFLAWPRPRGPEGHDGAQLGALWAAAYTDAVGQGFHQGSGTGCCNVGLDLPTTCRQQFSCALDVAKGSDLNLLGTYQGQPTGGGMTLLATVGTAPVCVCIVPKAKDPRVKLPRDSGLHLQRRELGEVVLYAVSKQPVEDALAGFVVP